MERTGHQPELLQDDCSELSRWLATRPGARRQDKEAAMGIRGRSLRVGDDAHTDYNGAGTCARVTIIEADYTGWNGYSQSGIQFRVRGRLKNCTELDWIDADWFEPVPPSPATADLWPDAESKTPNVGINRHCPVRSNDEN